MITPPSKASWHNARESVESCGTIYLDLHRMDTLVTIRKSVDVIFVHMFDDPFVISKFEYFFTVFVYYFTVLSRDLISLTIVISLICLLTILLKLS